MQKKEKKPMTRWAANREGMGRQLRLFAAQLAVLGPAAAFFFRSPWMEAAAARLGLHWVRLWWTGLAALLSFCVKRVPTEDGEPSPLARGLQWAALFAWVMNAFYL